MRAGSKIGRVHSARDAEHMSPFESGPLFVGVSGPQLMHGSLGSHESRLMIGSAVSAQQTGVPRGHTDHAKSRRVGIGRN